MAKTVYVGSARSDENGKAYGGKAGDQKSGKEVSTQVWYDHELGWDVLRAKDPEKAAIIGQQMQAACDNNKIGYDQWERYDLFAEAKKVGFDMSKVTNPTECDCSELVRCCCAAAGIMDLPTSGFRTGNMVKHMLATGEFVQLKGEKYEKQPHYLGAGDVLITKTSGHTVVVLNNGDKYEGAASVIVPVKTFGVDILRKGDAGEAVQLMQRYLLELGYDLGSRGIDGDFGSKTETALKSFQQDKGLTVDGEYGAKSHAALMAAIEAKNNVTTLTPEPVGDLTVKPGTWRIRKGPGTAYPTAGFVEGGDKLTKIDMGKWVPVDFGDELGFISKDALKEG